MDIVAISKPAKRGHGDHVMRENPVQMEALPGQKKEY
jgi:hypothetical protein